MNSSTSNDPWSLLESLVDTAADTASADFVCHPRGRFVPSALAFATPISHERVRLLFTFLSSLPLARAWLAIVPRSATCFRAPRPVPHCPKAAFPTARLVSHVSVSLRICPDYQLVKNEGLVSGAFRVCFALPCTQRSKARRRTAWEVPASCVGGWAPFSTLLFRACAFRSRTCLPPTHLHRRGRLRTPRGRRHGAVCAHVHRRIVPQLDSLSDDPPRTHQNCVSNRSVYLSIHPAGWKDLRREFRDVRGRADRVRWSGDRDLRKDCDCWSERYRSDRTNPR